MRDYYFNGGGAAVVVRLATKTAEPASIAVHEKLVLEAKGPGKWGNDLVVEVAHPEDKLASVAAKEQGLAVGDGKTDGAEKKLFHLTVREGAGGETRSVETYPNVTMIDGPRRVDAVLDSSRLVKVQAKPFETVDTRPGEKVGETAYRPPKTKRTGSEGQRRREAGNRRLHRRPER